MPQTLTIEQWEKYEGDDWWTWAVWIEGRDEALDHIDFVEWTLHPTFSNPIRRTSDRASRFRLETGGWGQFQIHARVQMKDGSQIKLRHYLKLNYPDGTETTE
jgi:transcription initiation factor IIF auxiliary subunit